jgi:hypothetical protein
VHPGAARAGPEQDPKAIPAEENVEALCHLFTTVGKQLEESAKSKMAFDTYFSRLKAIGESRALPSRIWCREGVKTFAAAAPLIR